MSIYVFVFFKQKTAYEMRISDWSSDVCSSDLIPLTKLSTADASAALSPGAAVVAAAAGSAACVGADASGEQPARRATTTADSVSARNGKIGRASGRERVCQ